MFERPIIPENLRAAAVEIATAERARATSREALDALSRVVAEALLDQAEHRAAAVSPSKLDGAVALALPSGDALAVLRSGARNDAERCLVACLCARHLGAVLERRDGVSALRAMLPSLDWLEFTDNTRPTPRRARRSRPTRARASKTSSARRPSRRRQPSPRPRCEGFAARWPRPLPTR